MQEFFDDNFLTLVTSLNGFFKSYYGHFVGMGKAIGAVLCLVIVAKEAFQMMLLKRSVDVLVFIRPILISTVLAFWGPVTSSLRMPFDGIEKWAKTSVYQKEVAKVEQLHVQRWKVKFNQYNILQKARAEAELANDQMKQKKSFWDQVVGTVKSMWGKAVDAYRTVYDLKHTINNSVYEWIIETISKIVWYSCVLLTFFAKEIALGILTITGPISIGMSVLPIWKDNWASWLSRYLSFCLYGFVAYMIMAAAMQLFKYGIQVDIKQLSTPGFPSIFNYNYLYSLVAAVVGGYGLKMTPEIVSWIFPTGTSQAVNAFVNGIQRSTTKAISTGAKATAGAI